jgi:hypothetical protein
MQKSKKKMCQTDEKKRRGAEVFSTPFFLSIPFQIKILIKERALITQ